MTSNLSVRRGELAKLVVLLTLIAPPASAQTVSFRGSPASPVPVGRRPVSVAAADFNRDTRLDLAVVNSQDNNVSVLLGLGSGTFIPAPSSPFTVNASLLNGSIPTALALGDFNRDGRLDLAVTNVPVGLFTSGGAVAVLLGQGNGAFNPPTNFSTGGDLPGAVAVGDFNGDVNLDLAVTNLNSGQVAVLLGNGSGTSFTPAAGSPFGVGFRPASIAAADVDANSKADLVVANADNNALAILMGQGNGTFVPNASSPLPVGQRPAAVSVADFDHDGKLDLAIAELNGSTVSVALGDGTGTFPTRHQYPVGRYPRSVAVADFNADGKPDVVVANTLSDLVSILTGNGDGTFKRAINVSVAGDPQSVAIGDVDGNSQPDVVVANTTSNNVSVMLNTTDIVPPVTTATAMPPPNSNGWNNANVTVTLNATDNTGGSGVRQLTYQIGGGPQTVVASSSTALTFTTEGVFPLVYFATDNAGNVEASQSLAVKIDKTPPTIVTSQSPPANGAGWNNSDVSVTFSCADTLSQIASCTPPVLVSSEGSNQPVIGVAVDQASNSATTSRAVSLDKTAPVLSMPVLAASYLYNAPLALTFGASDALSGLLSSNATFNGAPIVSGTTVTLNHAGVNTFTLAAVDVAGNSVTQSATFVVLYNFAGFLPPVPNDGGAVFKLGSVIPVKFSITDANGAAVSVATARLRLQMFSGGLPVGTPLDATPPGNADTGDLFRYDGAQYIYNLSTKPFQLGTWQLQVHLDDGTVHSVAIGLK